MANLIKIDLLLTSTEVCRKAPWFWMAQNEPEKAKAAEIYNSLLDCQERIIPEGRHFYGTFQYRKRYKGACNEKQKSSYSPRGYVVSIP